MAEFLLEIGTEEIPASFILPALVELSEKIRELLASKAVSLEGAQAKTLATPRRLTIWMNGVPDESDEQRTISGGMPLDVAIDEKGNFREAARRFASSRGADVSDLKRLRTDKGKEIFALEVVSRPRPTRDILAEGLPSVISGLSFPKRMYWRGPSLLFARPIRYIACIFGEEVVSFDLSGVRSGREIAGHPFLAPEKFSLESASLENYKKALRERSVIVDCEERKVAIRSEIDAILMRHGSSFRRSDEELLEEVTFLVEFPGVLEGSFDKDYLKLPPEVLEEALREHQRFFPVRDAKGELLPKFIAVANRPKASSATIRQGFERVIASRLADASFFWKADTSSTLESKLPRLDHVVFITGVGTVGEKRKRLEESAPFFARAFGGTAEQVAHARRAAHLAKADLVTQMVGEFPSLQGIMGGHYAEDNREHEEVCGAISEHYLPRYAEDKVPKGIASAALAIADKLDTLAACFLMGLIPTGSQDPYALRRRAQGIVRITWDNQNRLRYRLSEAIRKALELLPEKIGDKEKAALLLLDFFRERLTGLAEEEKVPYDIVRAVLATGFDDLLDFRERLEALVLLREKPTVWESLVILVERTYNISKNLKVEGEVRPELFQEDLERLLHRLYVENADSILDSFRARSEKGYVQGSIRYEEAFAKPVHEFYEKVYVNVPDAAIRNNRLALLKKINELYSKYVADLSQIVRK